MNPIDYLTRFWAKKLYRPSYDQPIGLVPYPRDYPVLAKVMAWINVLCGVGGVIMFIDWLVKLIWP